MIGKGGKNGIFKRYKKLYRYIQLFLHGIYDPAELDLYRTTFYIHDTRT